MIPTLKLRFEERSVSSNFDGQRLMANNGIKPNIFNIYSEMDMVLNRWQIFLVVSSFSAIFIYIFSSVPAPITWIELLTIYFS